MTVELIGSNPMATLVKDGRRNAIVSIWDVAWSARGSGRAVVAWAEGDPAVRLVTSDQSLGRWLGETFTRHFPEFEGLPPIADPVECRFTEWLIEPTRARVEAVATGHGRIAASIGDPVGTRPAHVRDFPLGEPGWTLTNLLTFCAEARIELDGEPVEGGPEVTSDDHRTSSTAFIAVHETWTRDDRTPGGGPAE
ncbi:hypothetical protein [Glycomyces salinus]|uniref:hypothetical protein n=1 Tax=Glycomyces salinus TaxID=980294 RepID=UPI0018ED60CE|nr:hypothetical protein [Glycomyces salinus]